MIEYGRFFTKLYRIRRGYYRRNITIRLSVGYEYRLKNKEIFKEVFVSLRGRNIATFKFREQLTLPPALAVGSVKWRINLQ